MSMSLIDTLECVDHYSIGEIGMVALGIMLMTEGDLKDFVLDMSKAASEYNICPCLITEEDYIA